jgi:hypothetical protein
LKDAQPVIPSNAVEAPKYIFNIDLRFSLLIRLGLFFILCVVPIIVNIRNLINPFMWFFLITDAINALGTGIGFWGVYKIIPEWMVTYSWFLILFFFLQLIRLLSVGFAYGFVGVSIYFAFQAIFTISLIWSMSRLRVYALTIKNGGVPV